MIRKSGGQFAPAGGGQFAPARGGQFDRHLHLAENEDEGIAA